MPDDHKNLRLSVCLRVSTARQLDGYGPDAQEADCRAWAAIAGHQVVSVGIDAITGESDIKDRPVLLDALNRMKAGDIDGILVPSLDRLARTLVIQEATLGTIWKAGGRVFTVSGEVLADDPNDPVRTLIRQVLGAVHEFDRATLKKRLRDGRSAKHDRGGYAYGAPRFGERAVDRRLEPDADEQEVIRLVHGLHDDGLSYAGIAAHLNDLGVPTKRRGRWHPTTVARLLDPAHRERNAAYGQRRRTRARRKAA